MTENNLADIVYKEQPYHVLVHSAFLPDYIESTLVFRPANSESNTNDKLITTLKASVSNFKKFAANGEVINGSRPGNVLKDANTVVGFGTRIGTAFCAKCVPADTENLALLMEVVWNYEFENDGPDCIGGIVQNLADFFSEDKFFNALLVLTSADQGMLKNGIAESFNLLCVDVKNNPGYSRESEKEKKEEKSEKEFNGDGYEKSGSVERRVEEHENRDHNK